MPDHILLIGTWHLHAEGQTRLRVRLDTYAPDAVALELAPEEEPILRDFEHELSTPQHRAALRDRLVREWEPAATLLGAIRPDTLDYVLDHRGYEYFVAKRYCRERAIPLHFIDLPSDTHTPVRFHLHNAKLATMPLENLIRIETQATSEDEEPLSMDNAGLERAWRRDQHMAERLAVIPGRIAVAVGAQHVFGDYQNLYARLKYNLNLPASRVSL